MGDVFCFLFFCVVIHGELFHDLTHITSLFVSIHRIICCFSHTRLTQIATSFDEKSVRNLKLVS